MINCDRLCLISLISSFIFFLTGSILLIVFGSLIFHNTTFCFVPATPNPADPNNPSCGTLCCPDFNCDEEHYIQNPQSNLINPPVLCTFGNYSSSNCCTFASNTQFKGSALLMIILGCTFFLMFIICYPLSIFIHLNS